MDRQLQRKNSNDSHNDIIEARRNIKNSLEKQKLLNKQKFEDPYFIKIDDTENNTNLKIVKNKAKNDDTISDDYSFGTIENRGRRMSGQRTADSKKISQMRKEASQTVQEADESEESSPKLRTNSTKRSPTRNIRGTESSMNRGQNKVVNLESENYEKVSDDPPKTIPQLVKLDVNLDTLKNFLEDIQEAINDHAKSIGIIQTDMKKKATEKTVIQFIINLFQISHYLQKISEGLHKECGERPHAFRLENEKKNFLAENYQSEDSVQLKRSAEKVTEKLEIIGLNIINFNKFKQQTDDRIEKLERQLPKCFTVDQFREESQNLESRTLKYINDQLGTFQENLNNYKKELNEALTHFDKKVNDNQSATVWRIKDCEELLKSRVSDKYVNDAIKTMEDKLTKQMGYNDEKQVERLEKTFKELGNRIIQTNQFFNEKSDDLRKIILMYDNKIASLATNEKLITVQTGYKDMKYNIEREMEMLQEHVKETKDKIGELNKRFSNLETTIQNGGDFSYQVYTAGGGGGAGAQHHSNQGTSRNQFQGNQASDNHKKSSNNLQNNNQKNVNIAGSPAARDKTDSLSQLQQQPQISMQSNSSPTQNYSPLLRKRQTRQMDAAFAAELEKRMVLYDENFDNLNAKLESLKRQLDEKVTKDDVRKLTSDKITKEDLDNIIPSEEITNEKMKYLVREEIEILQSKLQEQFKQFDNKIIRLRAELDIHSIQRQLERKANEDQVRSDFNNHEFKISTLDRNIIRMASDFETFQIAINKIHNAIVELQEANRDVLLGKKTNNCLSCGKGGDTTQTVKGKDGRMYKAADQVQARLNQDDSTNLATHYNNQRKFNNEDPGYESQTPMTGMNGPFNDLSQNQSGVDLGNNNLMMGGGHQEFFKMRPSHSFYDSNTNNNMQGGYETNLPSLNHNKNTSLVTNVGIYKNLQTGAMSGAGALGGGGSGNVSQMNVSYSNSYNNNTGNNKRKLPFGFQVQQEKKELFKVGSNQVSAKRAISTRGRPESAGYNKGL